MGETVYVSQARIEREDGPIRRAHLPAETDPTWYGTHGSVAEHYGHASGGGTPSTPPHSTTWSPPGG